MFVVLNDNNIIRSQICVLSFRTFVGSIPPIALFKFRKKNEINKKQKKTIYDYVVFLRFPKSFNDVFAEPLSNGFG